MNTIKAHPVYKSDSFGLNNFGGMFELDTRHNHATVKDKNNQPLSR